MAADLSLERKGAAFSFILRASGFLGSGHAFPFFS